MNELYLEIPIPKDYDCEKSSLKEKTTEKTVVIVDISPRQEDKHNTIQL
jgi:hypothetical protein